MMRTEDANQAVVFMERLAYCVLHYAFCTVLSTHDALRFQGAKLIFTNCKKFFLKLGITISLAEICLPSRGATSTPFLSALKISLRICFPVASTEKSDTVVWPFVISLYTKYN